MQVDVIVVGQGICGTLLSWFLQREGKTFLVVDEAAPNTATRASAGLINPVTGRRYATTWMAEELHAFARLTYEQLGVYLQQPLFSQKSIIDFFPTPQMRNTFVDRISENDTYLHPFPDQNRFNSQFTYEFGCGEIKPAYTAHLQNLLPAWRQKLLQEGTLREEKFVVEDLKVEAGGVEYRNVSATKIVFCDGVAGAGNPWFSLLPFSANKGEALVLECKELDNRYVYKRGLLLVPLPEEGLFWFGANFQWEYTDAAPSTGFYQTAADLLGQWLKVPFTIVDHKAAVRPVTVERRPFVGFHPQVPAVGLLNGMGTKGASLAPFFAHQLVQHLVHGFPITPEADVHRFQRILSK